MKNIHVLPTDKPSRLIKSIEKGNLFLSNRVTCGSKWINQNIYIASNDDINENDYIITKDGRLVQVSYLLSKDLEGASKVILTTDDQLIADGIQAIDDEFLEWFVKNPSCEEVYISYGFFTPMGRQIDPLGLLRNHSQCVWKYKIIIPKEEPKQELDCPFEFTSRCTMGRCDCKPKQEPKQCKTPLDCGKVYNEELTTQTVTCSKCGNTHTFPFGGDYYCPSPKQETTLEEMGKKVAEYCKQYVGTDKYDVAMLAIEFGYNLNLDWDEK